MPYAHRYARDEVRRMWERSHQQAVSPSNGRPLHAYEHVGRFGDARLRSAWLHTSQDQGVHFSRASMVESANVMIDAITEALNSRPGQQALMLLDRDPARQDVSFDAVLTPRPVIVARQNAQGGQQVRQERAHEFFIILHRSRASTENPEPELFIYTCYFISRN